jgi:hypothetical protein
MKEDYRTNRELLDNLLIEYDIPKEYWHNMNWLNSNLIDYFNFFRENGQYEDFTKAINLIHKLSPIPLTKLYAITYDE